MKLDSFWAGEWQGTWTVKDGVLSGDLKIRAHYFEMGNIQFNLDKTFDSINVQNINDAKDIIAAIKKVEDKVSTRKGLFIINLFVIYLVSTGPRRHVLQYSRKSVEKN